MSKESFAGFPQLQAQIRGKTLRGVYLFDGEEENMKQAAWNAIRKAVLPEGLEELNENILDAPEVDALIAACETLPFMGDTRLVLVRDQAGLNSAKSDVDDRLLEYLAHVPDFTVLVFYHIGQANGSRKLFKAIQKSGQVIRFEHLRDAELTQWVIRAFEQEDRDCSAQTANMLIFTCGTDTGLLRTEIAKLSAYVPPEREVTEADIREIATPSIEARIFDLVDAVVAGNDGRAFSLLRDLRLSGSKDIYVISMLLRQFRLMQHLKIMLYEKVPQQEITQLMGLQPFALDRMRRQASSWPGALVKAGTELCLDMEAGFKSGKLPEAGLADSLILKLLTMKKAPETVRKKKTN